MEIVRELKTPALVQEAANLSMKALNDRLKKGENIPMSEFAKVLIWEKKCLCEIFDKETENNRRHGAKMESHTWCGEPYHEFSVPSLGIRPL